MIFPSMWYVRPANPQISLRIRAVWSEPLLVAWVFYDCLATDWTPSGVSKLKRRLHRLVWVYVFQNATLLENIMPRLIVLCYMTGENPTSWLAHFLFENLCVYLIIGLNWLTAWYEMKTSSNQFPEVNSFDTFLISPFRERKITWAV